MNFFDPQSESLVNPYELVTCITRRRNAKALEVEPCTLICVTSYDLRFFVKETDAVLLKTWRKYREIYRGYVGGHGVVIVRTQPGAPSCVALAEELVTFGTRRILFFGYCGSLQREIKGGDIIVPNGAIREEGTSYHYLPPETSVQPDQRILNIITSALRRTGISFYEGKIWTTDAIYRETITKVRHYQGEGILGVEMELSALFAFGMAKGVSVGGILMVTDELSTNKWRPCFFSPRFLLAIKKGRRIAMEVLRDMADDFATV